MSNQNFLNQPPYAGSAGSAGGPISRPGRLPEWRPWRVPESRRISRRLPECRPRRLPESGQRRLRPGLLLPSRPRPERLRQEPSRRPASGLVPRRIRRPPFLRRKDRNRGRNDLHLRRPGNLGARRHHHDRGGVLHRHRRTPYNGMGHGELRPSARAVRPPGPMPPF